jgi:hypothetical protein
MAEYKYNTIQQHQQLRVPSEFGRTGKQFVLQLDEILDDVYRRFGRLTMNDMGKEFQDRIITDEGNIAEMTLDITGLSTRIGTAEGNITTLTITTAGLRTDVDNKIAKTATYQTADEIVTAAEGYTDGQLTSYSTTSQTNDAIALYVGNNAYQIQSGIAIDAYGIDVTGSKYVKIRSGGSFEVDSTNLKINSTTGAISGYEIDGEGHISSAYNLTQTALSFANGVGSHMITTQGGSLFVNSALVFSKSISIDSSRFGGGMYLHGYTFVLDKVSSQTLDPWLLPYADDTCQVGSSGRRFSKIYAKDFYGALTGNASSATKLSRAPTYGELSGRAAP